MATAGEFVGLMFFERSVAHANHLTTSMFSRHDALQKFYEGIVELADSFSEAYIGRFGDIDEIQMSWTSPEDEIIDFLQGSLEWIEANRYIVAPQRDTALQNIIDEIVSLHLSTLFLLKRLM